MRKAVLLASSVLSIGLAFSCNTQEFETNAILDPIKIDTGYVSGTMIGEVGKEVRIYRGIPYAAPPVGELRWKPPQPPAPWSGIRECTDFGKSAPQPAGPIDLAFMPQSEDCLYLNVLTPAKEASDNLPVMVWLHGGGYLGGSGSDPLFNLPRLPQNGVVLVTINMRLGSLGLLAHPLLSNESPKGISGNYMFFDMIAALEWVQRNIAAFGGNSENLTIFGESGGGWKVSCLTASPLANALFHKAIFQSGVTGEQSPGVPMNDMELIGEKFFARLGVEKEADPLKAARALPSDRIIETERSLSEELNKSDGLCDSAIDGRFLTNTPAEIFRAGKQNPMPVITSANLGELTGPGNYLMPHLIPDYVNILNGVNRASQKGYACIFDQVPSKWKQEGCVSFHAIELAYVFGDWGNSAGWLSLTFKLLAEPAGAKTLEPGFTDLDRKISENLMAMWAQFARTGDPNVEGFINWPAYDTEIDQYLYIAEPLQVKPGFSKVAQKE